MSLDRAWTYDQVGRLIRAYTGVEANANWTTPDGPYARGYDYDPYGNLTKRDGWGGAGRNVNANYVASFTDKNQRIGHSYDLAGNITSDGGQAFTYNAQGQAATASFGLTQMGYDGDGLRLKKVENGTTTYYLRSTVLGQQVACELSGNGVWQRGYVYLGGSVLALQDKTNNRVLWTHQEPYAKSQRITDANGEIVAGVELEPFGLETNRSFDYSAVSQKRQFTTYERDGNNSDEAMFRRYNRWGDRFDQPDPYEGSMSQADPQSLNRYAYVQNDPVNFVDPSGLLQGDWWAYGYGAGNGWSSLSFGFWGMSLIREGAPPRGHLATGSLGISDGRERDTSTLVWFGTPNDWGGFFGGGGMQGRTGRTPTPCGLNPITGEPGFTRNPTGVEGNLRPGVGGSGDFNASRGDRLHQGLDISGVSGQTPVFAFYPGRVSAVEGSASDTDGYGLSVIVDHGGGYTSRYSHLSSASVQVGDTVAVFGSAGLGRITTGQIGIVGQSGNASGQLASEAHVHFEVRLNGVALNPATFLNSPCPVGLPTK